jgi:hypothetical protein
MTLHDLRVQEAVELVRKFCPDFKITPKVSSRMHRVIGGILGLLGNSGYLQTFWTTIGFKAYYPPLRNNGFSPTAWTLVLHEGKHAIDALKTSRPLFSLLYLSPQVIGIAALVMSPVVLVAGWSMWWLLGILALLPLPSWARYVLEARAFEVSVCVDYWWWGGIEQNSVEGYVEGWLVASLCGPDYYWTWPFKPTVRSRFVSYISRLKQGKVEMTPYLLACRELCSKYHKEDKSLDY